MELLAEFNEKDGVTILCNLHLPDLAQEFGTRMLALSDGQIVYDGPAGNLNEMELSSLYAEGGLPDNLY